MKRINLRNAPIFVFLVFLLVPSSAVAATTVDRDIQKDTTWTARKGPYRVTRDIVLEEGVSLKVEPGVIVEIYPEKTIEVKGNLQAIGTAQKPITFTAFGKNPWGTIYFTDFSDDAQFSETGAYTAGCILSHCIIEKGGGLFVRFGAPLITQCEIRENVSSGIRVEFGGPRIVGNRIYANSTAQDPASGNGGGIIAYTDKDVLIADNIVYNNISDGGRDGGGGVYVYAADNAVVTVSNNIIFGNTSSRFGGGIYAYKGILSHNTVLKNEASVRGGGIYAVESQVADNVVQNNVAERGAGIFTENGEIRGNSIIGNRALRPEGGGLHYFGSGLVENNCITGNSATGEDGCGAIYISGNPLVRGNNIFANSGYALYIANVADAPDVLATENYWGTASEQAVLRLTYDWIDNELAGLAIYRPLVKQMVTAAPAPPPMHVKGSAGEDEIELVWENPAGFSFSGHRVYIGSGSGYPYDRVVQTGPAEKCLIKNLESGKNYYFAVAGLSTAGETEAETGLSEEISIFYKKAPPLEPLRNLTPPDKTAGMSREITLKASPPETEAVTSLRWQIFLSGETSGIPAIDTVTTGKNLQECRLDAGELEGGREYSWRVAARSATGNWSAWSSPTVFSTAADSSSVIFGPIASTMKLEKGRSPYLISGNTIIMPEGTLLVEPGVEVRVAAGKNLKIRGTLAARGTASDRIVFTRDSSAKWGSIIFSDLAHDARIDKDRNYVSGTVLENCTIEEGKGIIIESASPLIKNCVVANHDGSGIVVRQGGPLIVGNDIHHNTAPTNGGGIYAYTNDIIMVTGNKIHENIADGDGGGIYAYGYMNTSTIHVENNDISHNKATGNGGGVYLSRSSAVANRIESNSAKNDGGGVYSTFGLVDKNRISNNQADQGAGIFTEHNSSITRNYISGNRALSKFGGGVYINFWGTSIENETFTKNTVTGNQGPTSDDNGGIFVVGYLVFQENNVYENSGSQLYNGNESGSSPLITANCYWGSTDRSNIAEKIIDEDDNPKLGKVTFEPFLSEPISLN